MYRHYQLNIGRICPYYITSHAHIHTHTHTNARAHAHTQAHLHRDVCILQHKYIFKGARSHTLCRSLRDTHQYTPYPPAPPNLSPLFIDRVSFDNRVLQRRTAPCVQEHVWSWGQQIKGRNCIARTVQLAWNKGTKSINHFRKNVRS